MLNLAYLHSRVNRHYFFYNLYRHFKKIKVTDIFTGKPGWFDLQYLINNFDYYHIGSANSFASTRIYWFRYIDPKYLINGRIISTSKSFIAEKFEEIFGKRLMVYAKDTQPYTGKIFYKNEVQTLGYYGVGNKVITDGKIINQRFFN